MLSDLNLDVDDDNGKKAKFLPLEIREMLINWNILDKNVDSISEDMKDEIIVNLHNMIDDLETQLNERIRWAIKTMAKARKRLVDDSAELIKLRKWREETCPIINLNEEMIFKMESDLSSVISQSPNGGKKITLFMRGKKMMKAENLETKEKLEKQKVKLQEEMKIEEQKMSEMDQKLAEKMADVIWGEMKLEEAMKEKESAIVSLAAEMSLKISELKSLMKTHGVNCDGDIEKLGKSIEKWKCIICKKHKEDRIIFLPCAHQVMCICCNDDDVDKGNTRCPCCHDLIENRISDILPFTCMKRL